VRRLILLLCGVLLLTSAAPPPAHEAEEDTTKAYPEVYVDEQSYIPYLHAELLADVPPSQRLTVPEGHPLYQQIVAAADIHIEINSIIRLQRDMRRVVRDGEEKRMYASVNRSERLGTSIDYQVQGKPVYLAFGYKVCVSFIRDHDGQPVILDRMEYRLYYFGGAYVLDMSGDGLIDICIHSLPATNGGLGVDTLTVLPSGRFKKMGSAGVANESVLTDLDGNGVWEIESNIWVYGKGHAGYYYRFIRLERFDHWQ
jgi:hypothetical protein